MLRTEYISTKEKRQEKNIVFNWDYILPVVLAFFISRASIIDRLTPFGLAFMGAYTLLRKSNILICVSTILGVLSFHGLKGIDYVVVTVIISIVFSQIESIKTLPSIKSSIITGSIFILAKSIFLLVSSNIFIYDLFIIIFEGIVVFALTYIFLYSFSTESIGKVYSNEKIICSFITLALVLSGFTNISIFGASIKNIISILVILFFGYTEGAFIGSTIGLVLGMVSYVSHPEMPFLLAIYGLAGLLAGVFRDLGKAGSILGFLLGNGIISFYINGYGISFLYLRELIVSTILFSVLYKPLDFYLSDHIDSIKKRAEEEDFYHRKDEMTIKRLNEMSEVFKELGETFKNSAEDDSIYNVKEVYELIDDIANSICSNCGMKKLCWEEGFYSTYYSMFKAISMLEENISLNDDSLSSFINDYCINKNEIKEEMKNHFDKFKINNMWKDRIIENRLLVAEQFVGIANIMEDMAKNIHIKPMFKKDMEEMVLANLVKNKVNVKKVDIVELEDNDIEVYVEVDKPYKKENSQDIIRKIVSDTIGVELKVEFNIGQSKKERHRFKLIRSNRYSALTEVISKTNYCNKVSGDSYTFGEGENSYIVALSDGMGVGRKANNESSIAINLLEKLLEAKFDKELALKTINSILMLKSNDEVFTTFDISLIDLYSGKLQVIKAGAPATFIRRKDRVDIINCQSLPVGILKDVDINVYEEYLEDGDIIIMMSDGLLEANEDIDNVERWMKDTIANINSLNPKKIADEIMSAVKEVSGGKVKDDMTLLVTKVWKTV